MIVLIWLPRRVFTRVGRRGVLQSIIHNRYGSTVHEFVATWGVHLMQSYLMISVASESLEKLTLRAMQSGISLGLAGEATAGNTAYNTVLCL